MIDAIEAYLSGGGGVPSEWPAFLKLCTKLGVQPIELERVMDALVFSGACVTDERGGVFRRGVNEVTKEDVSPRSEPEPSLQTCAKERAGRAPWRGEGLILKGGNPAPVLANAILGLRRDPAWEGVLAYDDFSLMTVARNAPPWPGGVAGATWTENDDRLTANWLQEHGVLVGVEIAAQAVQVVAQDNRFDPLCAYLDGLTWDGIQRLDDWLTTYLGVAPSEYSAAVGARWLVSGVARVYRPGCKSDCCLILEGPQGAFKSTALRTLADPWFSDELAELGSKDASLQTRGVWLVELSELESMTRGEISKIKAFMSRAVDRFRPPYGRRLIESPRRCIFAGTVNHGTYLRDDTGGRRFWPVACGRIRVADLKRDRDALWAEAVARFRSGAIWWLDSAELNDQAREEQAARYEPGVWDELLRPWLASRENVSIDDVLSFLVQKPKSLWTQADRNAINRGLVHMGWERYRQRTGNSLQWRYRRGKP